MKKETKIEISELRLLLENKKHYQVISGFGNKPTLLKGGAELLARHMGIIIKYELLEFDKGVSYTFKAIGVLEGELLGEGYGNTCNEERKFAKENGQPRINTMIKIAKKRAMVDLILSITALSGEFTQDIEDFTRENTTYKNNVAVEEKKKDIRKQIEDKFGKEKLDEYLFNKGILFETMNKTEVQLMVNELKGDKNE